MSIAKKLTTIAENQQRVFDEGKKTEQNAFWNDFQNEGSRASYQYAFMGIDADNFHPIYDMKPTGNSAINMFYHFNTGADSPCDMVTLLEECGVALDFSKVTSAPLVFGYANISRLGVLDFSSATSLDRCFIGAVSLTTIEKLIISEKAILVNTNGSAFNGCSALVNITFEGDIGNNVDLHWSPLLSRESIENIVSCLSTTASDVTLTLSQTAVDNAFTQDEWNALIADKTNWTISLV